jgi:hypothetical protein
MATAAAGAPGACHRTHIQQLHVGDAVKVHAPAAAVCFVGQAGVDRRWVTALVVRAGVETAGHLSNKRNGCYMLGIIQ